MNGENGFLCDVYFWDWISVSLLADLRAIIKAVTTAFAPVLALKFLCLLSNANPSCIFSLHFTLM